MLDFKHTLWQSKELIYTLVILKTSIKIQHTHLSIDDKRQKVKHFLDTLIVFHFFPNCLWVSVCDLAWLGFEKCVNQLNLAGLCYKAIRTLSYSKLLDIIIEMCTKQQEKGKNLHHSWDITGPKEPWHKQEAHSSHESQS